jgi:CubicO group peptidase (beta-lactamase class C family)
MLATILMQHWPQTTRRAILGLSLGAFGFSLLPGAAAGQRDRRPGQENSPVLRQAIADAAKKYRIPGIAAALIENGQLRAIEVFGVRDVNSNAPVTADTVFEAGSLGEPAYAYSVLLLSADGRFYPGAPLPSLSPLPYVHYLDPTSSLPATEPLYDPQFDQITAFRVMNHTSGLPDWARGQHLRLQMAPGKKWSYSNEGYLYLQNVIEHFTGEASNDFLARSILGPARMTRSSFVWRDADAADRATGYDRSGTPVLANKYARPAAATTLSTTIRDYSQFLRYILASAPAQRAHESAVSLLLNPTVSVDDPVPFSWGLGLGLEKTGDDLFFFHRGNGAGFQSFMIASRKSGRGLIIFTNSSNGLDAVPDIVAATLGGNHPVLKSAFLRSQ